MSQYVTSSGVRRYIHFFHYLWRQRPGLVKKDLWRTFLLVVFLPPFLALQLLHALAWRLDDLLFPGWQRQEVKKPLFVVGPPRSGTTLVHRTLAADSQFSTFATWECLLAPAAVEKWLCRGLMRLDRRFGRPTGRLLELVEQRLARRMDQVHAVRWTEPEEDYFVFIPQLTWFLLILPFPGWQPAWRFARGDTELASAERRQLLAYYRACLQKHLLVRGRGRTMLVKNPTFSGLVQSLQAEFPDARFLCCLREPAATVPSQLSSLRDGTRLFGRDLADHGLQQRLVALLAFYYQHLLDHLPPGSHRAFWLYLPEVQANLVQTMTQALQQLEYPLRTDFIETLQKRALACRRYRSGHDYDLTECGLQRQLLEKQFAGIYDAFDFGDGVWRQQTSRSQKRGAL